MSQVKDMNYNEINSQEEQEQLPEVPESTSDSLTENLPDTSEELDVKEDISIETSFLAHLDTLPDAEAKLRYAIDMMSSSIAQSGNPNFKSFWEARKHSLNLFKENISHSVRAQLWGKYTELSDEARRLREILDEQSAFAAEQIDIAIKALEEEIDHLSVLIEKAPTVEFPSFVKSLEEKHPFYNITQKELNILNAQASRINALRKELIKTEMRIRFKNKFFQRLSLLGDRVFPRRKELIKEISQHFIEDIDAFIDANFRGDEAPHYLFAFREEIKALQGIAKILTLNTQSFTHTRTRLSECWDKIKRLEKDRKKERSKLKEIFRQNFDIVMPKIDELAQGLHNAALSVQEANQRIDEISTMIHDLDLGREEVTELRSELNKSRKFIQDKQKEEELIRQQHETQRERQKQEKVQLLREKIADLLAQSESLDLDKISIERDTLLEEIQNAPTTRIEKQELERLLKPLKDIITEKRESALLNLSADDQQSLQQLKLILKQRKERRDEIKTQLEVYRKASGSSGFDFEKAMQYNTQINEEKERLEKINEGIQEIKNKILQIEGKR